MKTNIKNLGLDLFYERLENGLDVYIIPDKNSNNIYVTYTTKYGSIYNEFIPHGEKDYIKVPAGIAHFLEHKMFEQEDGIDPFKAFDNNGANANAFTNYKQTTYLFSCPNKFEENMKILLNYVNNPYFTEKNVEKEKGIIIQEIKMNDDSPFRTGYNRIIRNCFINHPIKTSTIGTIESVNSIKKEDLYKCYNTFYNPNNMFIVITGNIDPKYAFKIIKDNLSDKKIESNYKLKKYDEPNEVNIKEDVLHMNVTIPKITYAYKINIENTGFSKKITKQYLSLFLDCIFSGTSSFSEKLKSKKIIDEDIDYMFVDTDTHLLIIFLGETKKGRKLVKEIDKNLIVIPDKETFERKKKVFLSAIIYTSDNIFKTNNMISNSIINNGSFDCDVYNHIKELNYEDLLKLLKNIKFEYNSLLLIEPKK